MKNTIKLLAILILTSTAALYCADPFYTNLLNEGKQRYAGGKYEEALESFKLAEFGLLDEKEYVPELYYYYALTQYRNGAIGESRETLQKMKTVLGEVEFKKAKQPKAIESELFIMTRALNYLEQPGARPGMLPFFNLFYETWDLLKAKKLPEAEARLKIMDRMNGDKNRLHFLEGLLAFQKEDYKRCLKSLNRIKGPLPAEFGEEASFYLAYSYLKRGNLKESEKWAQLIKEPEHVHMMMELMDEIKAENKGNK